MRDYVCFPLPEPSSAVAGPSFARSNAARERHNALAASMAHLPSSAAQALEQLLSCLACGEESAVHVFQREGLRIGQEALQTSQFLLHRIALEERGHQRLLMELREYLPRSGDRAILRAMRRFYARLQSSDPALHFARIAALDGCVCRLMTVFLHRSTMMARLEGVAAVFSGIRQDEGRHVRVSRAHALALGLSPRQLQEEARWVRTSLVGLLEPVAETIEILGASPEQLFRRMLRGGSDDG
jgi:hypothetical protein